MSTDIQLDNKHVGGWDLNEEERKQLNYRGWEEEEEEVAKLTTGEIRHPKDPDNSIDRKRHFSKLHLHRRQLRHQILRSCSKVSISPQFEWLDSIKKQTSRYYFFLSFRNEIKGLE